MALPDHGQGLAEHERDKPQELAREAEPLRSAEEVAGHGAETTFDLQTRPVGAARIFAALRHHDFRLFWGGQAVSLIGTWMQIVAQSWLVLTLSNSAFVLGALGALQFLPILALSVFGGVLADRLPRRQVLLATQAISLVLAVVLGVLTQLGLVRIVWVMLLALLLGVVNAVDMPTRQAFVVDLVAPEDLRNAIALNSAAFNSARLVGPAVAGVAIGALGLPAAFYLNGLSFIAAIAGLIFVRAGRRPVRRGVEAASVGEDLREGLRYVAQTPLVWLVIVLVALVGTFGMNFNVLVPVLARDVLNVGASGFGVLASAAGAGSLAAALLLAYLAETPRPATLVAAAAALGVTEVLLGGVTHFDLALILLAASGFAMIFFTTLANTVLQTTTPDPLRGRVMSVYSTVFAGTTPIGSLIIGGLAQAYGVGVGFVAGGAISMAAAVAVALLGATVRGALR